MKRSSVELKSGVKFILEGVLCEITEVQVKLIRRGMVKVYVTIKGDEAVWLETADELLNEWVDGKLRFANE